MTGTQNLYKLIILYMLERVDFPLTTSQISEFIIEEGYTDFFKVQKCLSELKTSGLIREENTHKRTLYHLTDDGAETLNFFHKEISADIRSDIKNFFKEKKYELKTEAAVQANYYENVNHEFTVRCQIIERGTPLLDISITVPSESEAEKMSNNWTAKNEEVYALIMEKLL